MKRIAFILFASVIFNCSFAQEKKAFNFSLNHLALSVKDLQRSADFYRNVLGLEEITNRTEMAGIKWFSLGDGREIHFITILPGEIKITKAVHFALTTANFDDFVKYLDVANITYSDWPGKLHTVNLRADGIKQVYLQDPDGYWIEVNSVAVK